METQRIAKEIVATLGTGRQIEPFSQRVTDFDLPAAYRVAADVVAQRRARGDVPVGRKIGFTNRTIWAEYGVWAPIWGRIYDSTVHELAQLDDGLPLQGFAEPRIEPEIVFGIGRAPAAGMDEAALLDCIDWVAHGFEIVQSLFPGWRFTAADTIAAFGLHGALVIGARHPVAGARERWLHTLPRFDIELLRNGVVADQGCAANVLDGPLSALRHLVGLLANDPSQPGVAAGEIVTTGTLTRALPILPGELWSTRLSGIDLPGLRLRFV